MALNLSSIDNSWTLFLDRDGVINIEKYKDYIHTWEEFTFYDGAKVAIQIFSQRFHRIVVVTNQRGVAKGLTKMEDLEIIHTNMKSDVEEVGGKIDAIYFCPELESPNRKPNPGMGLQAAKDFPDIDLTKAIMVGNTMSDMEFGRNLGIHTVYLTTTNPGQDTTDERIDAVYPSLIAFALDL
ncbi:MAG: HAD family hydrolase [Bacteroidetes bacterium]|nr:HAD family hydrolase [Bacteroidota bacterium]